MKIVVGKFSSEPFHGLSNKDVEMLIKLVPESWIKDIRSVMLSAKICRNKGREPAVVFNKVNGKLEIKSRGFEPQQIASEVLYVLSELGGASTGKTAGKTTPIEMRVLDELIAPYLKHFNESSGKPGSKPIKFRR